jgi:hypothetical protein
VDREGRGEDSIAFARTDMGWAKESSELR